MIRSDEIKLPAQFQIALMKISFINWRNKEHSAFYRDSDRTAANVADLVVLHSTVRGFKAGSERARQVTNRCRGHVHHRPLPVHQLRRKASPRAGCTRQGPVLGGNLRPPTTSLKRPLVPQMKTFPRLTESMTGKGL